MACPPVHGDNPRALASGLSYAQVDKHDITILYHLYQCIFCLFDLILNVPSTIEPAAPPSRVKHSTTEPMRSRYISVDLAHHEILHAKVGKGRIK